MSSRNDACLLARALQAQLITEEQFSEILNKLQSSSTPLPELLASAARLNAMQIEALRRKDFTPSEGENRCRRALSPLPMPVMEKPQPENQLAKTTDSPGQQSDHCIPPRQMEQYQMVREVGRGGLGSVWLTVDRYLSRYVALKELLPGKSGGDAEARFVREARITGNLTHPGIVPVYELGRHPEGNYYYTMRYLEGRTYGDAIKAYHRLPADDPERHLKRNQLLKVFVDVCNAVAYAHSKEIIHRDLKPSNVMLGDYGETIVVDWGLAKVVAEADADSPTGNGGEHVHGAPGQLTGAGVLVGTPLYMSPEQAAGRNSRLDTRTDIYSLGVILYQVLVGAAPFSGKSAAKVLEKVRKGEFAPPQNKNRQVAPALEAICLKAMALKPEDRYATAQELADDVTRWLAGEPLSVYRDPWAVRAQRWAKRHRTFCFSTTTALVILVLALGGWWGYETQRLGELKTSAREKLHQGEIELAKGQVEDARVQFSGALSLVQFEPSLTGIKEDAVELLGQTEKLLASKRVRQRYKQFTKHVDDTYFYATRVTGLHQESDRESARQSAESALKQFFASPSEAHIEEVHLPYLKQDTRQQIQMGRVELLILLADLELEAGRGEKAMEYLQWAGDSPLQSLALRRAACYRLQGKPALAEWEENKAKDIETKEVVDWFFAGKDRYDAGNYKQAAEYFDKALRGQADHFWAQYYVAVSNLRLLQPEQAIPHLTACLSRKADFHWLYLLRGYAHGLRGEFDQAHADFAEAADLLDKEDYALLVNRSAVYLLEALREPGRVDRSKLMSAVADCKKANFLRPKEYQAYLNLARAYQELGKLDDALEVADQAVEKAAKLAEGKKKPFLVAKAYSTRGVVQQLRGDSQESQKDFQKALDATPKTRLEWAILKCEQGRYFYRQEQYEDALDMCNAALEKHDYYANGHRLKAETLLRLNRWKEAISAFDSYLECGGKRVADVYRARGLAYAKTGNYAKAVENYTLSLELDPQAPYIFARRGWAYLLAAPQMALLDFDTALKLRRNGDTLVGRGYALVQLGHHKEAIDNAIEAVDKSGREGYEVVYNAACVYAKAADVVELDPKFPKGKEMADSYRKGAVELIDRALMMLPQGSSRSFFIQHAVLPDPALVGLRHYPPFLELIKKYRKPPN